MSTTPAANEKTFEEILVELSGFQEYFTDDDKSKELATWLCEAAGINNKVAQLVIGNLAPLVLSALAVTGMSIYTTKSGCVKIKQ